MAVSEPERYEKWEEYLENCIQQVRCKKMRPVLEQELRTHMEDQMQDYLDAGVPKAEAVRLSAEQMGDPVETGVAFDRVHRPKMDWHMLGMILAAAFIGLFLYCLLYQEGIVGKQLFYNYLKGTVVGVPVMLAVCFADYTALAKFPGRIWGFAVAAAAVVAVLSPQTNGMKRVGWTILLLMPLFAGIVYRYRNQRYIGVGKVLGIFGTSWIVLWMAGALDMASMRILFTVGCPGMLIFAIAKGWYQIPRRAAWIPGGGFLLMTAAAVAYSYLYGGYRRERLLVWMTPEKDANGMGYIPMQMKMVRTNLHWLQKGSSSPEWLSRIMETEENYLLLGLMHSFGILASCVVLLFIVGLSICLFKKIWKIQNRLGALTGFACGVTLAVPFLLHTAVNLGLFPVTNCWLPFFSGGGKSCVAFYAVLGLLLSVFRNRSCAPELKDTAARKGSDSRFVIPFLGGHIECKWVKKEKA